LPSIKTAEFVGSELKYTRCLLPFITVAQENVDVIAKMIIIVFMFQTIISMSNFSRLIPFVAVFASIISTSKTKAQNAPYIPYNPNNNTTNKVYTNEIKEPIGNSKDNDTIILMRNTVSFHPGLLIDGTVAMGYERVLNQRKQAVRIVLGYSKLDQAILYEGNIKDIEQIYSELNYKFFLSRKNKRAPVGLYASPFFQFRQASYDFERNFNFVTQDSLYRTTRTTEDVKFENLKSYSIAGGVMLGYTAIVLEMVTLELYMGIGHQSVVGDYNVTYKEQKVKPLDSGFFWNNGPLFKLGCSIGVNF
jgi:hypothetical protein